MSNIKKFGHVSRRMNFMKRFLIFITCVAVLFLFYDKYIKSYPSILFVTDGVPCHNSVAKETIVPVEGAMAFLVSAYLDERESPPLLRIISIIDRHQYSQLYCHVCNGSTTATIRAQVQVHSDHFGFPYGTADILCLLPWQCQGDAYVSVTAQPRTAPDAPFLHAKSVRKAMRKGEPLRFAVCISTLFGGYNNVLQFIQALEMYQILGARKVFIYKSDSSALLQRVLDHYVAAGVLEVIQWDIQSYVNVSPGWEPSSGGELHYYGQIAALNDCVYRNMASAHYVVLNDIDELIVPRRHDNWTDMVRFLSRRFLGVETFIFKDSVFRNEVFGDDGTYDLWPGVPGINVMRHVHREPSPLYSADKPMVNPRAVVWTSVHKMLHSTGGTLHVPVNLARLHHCRKADNRHVDTSQLVKDTTLWKHSEMLVKNVNHVLKKLNLVKSN